MSRHKGRHVPPPHYGKGTHLVDSSTDRNIRDDILERAVNIRHTDIIPRWLPVGGTPAPVFLIERRRDLAPLFRPGCHPAMTAWRILPPDAATGTPPYYVSEHVYLNLDLRLVVALDLRRHRSALEAMAMSGAALLTVNMMDALILSVDRNGPVMALATGAIVEELMTPEERGGEA